MNPSRFVILSLIIVIILSFSLHNSPAYAQNDCDGTTGNDTIDCASSPNTPDAIVDGGLGNDNITVQAGVTVSEVNGDSQSGGVASVGTGGFDLIDVYGTVTGDVNGDGVTGEGRDDTIRIFESASVLGDINGNDGDDVIVIDIDADVGVDNAINIDGGGGEYDVLVLDVTDLPDTTIDQIRTNIDNLNTISDPVAGTNFIDDTLVVEGTSYVISELGFITLYSESVIGGCDGTPQNDTINCTNEENIYAGLGDDNITVAGITVNSLSNIGGDIASSLTIIDGLSIVNAPATKLGNDTIVVNSVNDDNSIGCCSIYFIGDGHTGQGGDDVITNNANLEEDNDSLIFGDWLGSDATWGGVFPAGDGGNDTITNNGTMSTIHGDLIVMNRFTLENEITVGGDDIITNDGTLNFELTGDTLIYFGDFDALSTIDPNLVTTIGGNDTIINNGVLQWVPHEYDFITEASIMGDDLQVGAGSMGGNDNITNNGTARRIYGDFITHMDYITGTVGGQDTIINTGIVQEHIYGDYIVSTDTPLYWYLLRNVGTLTGEGASDIITNSGEVGGAIYAEGGDDVVNLQDGANGGADNSLTIDGGSGIDILNFSFINLSQSIIDALLVADPASGSIVINGQTFIWLNFEQIITGTLPAPSEPTNMLVSGDIENPPAQPIYSWDHIPVATSYQFYVGGPSGQIINQTLVVGVDVTCNATCDFQPAIDLVQGNYTWWMQATNDSGSSEWVQGPNFYVGPAAPVAPTGLTTSGSLTQPPVLLTYTWDWDTSVAWYQVVVNSPSGTVFNTWFDASLICSESICSITPETALTINGDYLWWVGGWNETAQTWSDSAGASFTVAIPLPIAPENPVISGSLTQPPVLPTYSWDVDENVLWYQVVLTGATSGTIFNTWFDASVICDDTTCTISPTNELNNDAYTLWIGGWNPVGQTWNAGENFTVAIPLPAVPNNALVSGSLTQPPVLPTYSWDVDENVLWYQVVLTGATSGTIFNSWHDASLICGANTCTITPPNELSNDTYTLWIGGWNTIGQTWNAGEIFVIDIPLPAVPTNITISGTYNQPTYSWDRDVNVLWYQVILNNSGGASVFNTWHEASVICVAGTCSITPVNVLSDGTYTLWVGGWNSSGQTWNAGESIPIAAP